MTRFLPALALFALVAGCDMFSASHAYCARIDECLQEENVDGDNDDSDDGSDDVAVCTQGTQAFVESLNANSEPECKELAAAYEETLRCVATLDCDEVAENDFDGECEAEGKALQKVIENVADDNIDCESIVF